MKKRVLLLIFFILCSICVHAETTIFEESVWWFWPLILFIISFIIGIVSVLAGIGGGILYVPIVSGFLPFHLDFVRGTALIMALSGSIAAGSRLLKKGLASLRLAMPFALIASISSIVGALIGLGLETEILEILLGITILFVVVIMIKIKKPDHHYLKKGDHLSEILHITGIYHDTKINKDIKWKIHNTPLGLILFILIGIVAGMFGIGAGWANVPVLNLVLDTPIKVAVATSHFLLSITDTSAAWIYLNKGAVLPLMVIPSVIGVMLGSIIGSRLLPKIKSSTIRNIVIVILAIAGLKALQNGIIGII